MNGVVKRKEKKRNHAVESSQRTNHNKKIKKESRVPKQLKTAAENGRPFSHKTNISMDSEPSCSHDTANLQITPSKSEFNVENSSPLKFPSILDTYLEIDDDSKEYERVIDEFVNCDISGANTEMITCDLVPSTKGKVHTKKKNDTVEEVEPVKVSKKMNQNTESLAMSIESDESNTTEDSISDISEPISEPSSELEELEEDLETSRYLTQDVQNHLPVSSNLIVVKEGETIYFHGVYRLKVLHGEIEILGYKMNKNSPTGSVYSLRGSSLLYLRNNNACDNNEKIGLRDIYPEALDDYEISRNCCVLQQNELNEPKMGFIYKHVSQQLVSKVNETLEPIEGKWNYIKVDETWNGTIDLISSSTKIMITGGKGVGKSTFLRYAINRLLSRFSKIRIVDLDPGQSEFTVPGCISIVTVEEPLFGANYTHLKKTDKAILSNINVAYDPIKYITEVKRLLTHLQAEGVPILINTMGFTHGIGIHILASVLYQIQPTDVLQILSDNPKKNFKGHLDPETIKTDSALFGNDSHENLEYNLHFLESMCNENTGWKAESRQIREMCILSYFGKKMDPCSLSLYCSNLHPFEVELDAINLADGNGDIIHPAAVNANLVSLCYVDNPDLKTFACLGWGIVKGIDIPANILVLITPEELDILQNVTHLVLNSGVMLPPSVYMTHDRNVGVAPYVIEGELTFFGEFTKRSHISVKK